ncbi:MAG: hypothetical protein GWO00_13365 [Gemmatimonadetes bacterium]|nr:hypothetical protein [Gemmatimonadota bacterium]NIU36439.1 hypothetical protein [Gemmatimonadota bacterium]NIV62186.1 hypothetical protein [Gemmatimonadota bacterium]NIV83351.1 hypothetical protein [Gemmatimonadota bacterium]NIW64908.1 hypothetical protein [Gemmatimonadota bacterium]
MEREIFDKQLRRFLKKVGISSQEGIDQAVERARQAGGLDGTEARRAEVTVRLPDLDEEMTIEDRTRLE